MTSKHSARGRGSRAASCRECSARSDDGAIISARGLCLECGNHRAGEAARQMMARKGPYYDEYVRSLTAYASRLHAHSG